MDITTHDSCGRQEQNHIDNLSFIACRGFTLVELLTILAIIAITLGIGIPSVSAIILTNRLAEAMNSLSGSFAYARSEAITRNHEVVICKSSDGLFCTREGNWEQGWIIYHDKNENEKRDEAETLLWVQDALPPGIEVRLSAFRSTHFVHYWASGFTKMNGTFTFCQENSPAEPKALILNKVGRIRNSKTHWDGSPLECGE